MTKHTEGQLEIVAHSWKESGLYDKCGNRVALVEIDPDVTEETQDELEAVMDANARRLVACWNACQGLDTDLLESITMLGETLADRFELRNSTERELTTQRDELLEALEHLMEMTEPPEPNCSCHTNPPCNDCIEYGGLREAWEGARGAIASVNKGAS